MSQPFDPERIFLGIYSKVLIIKRGKALLAILFAVLLCIILKIRNNVNNEQERQYLIIDTHTVEYAKVHVRRM